MRFKFHETIPSDEDAKIFVKSTIMIDANYNIPFLSVSYKLKDGTVKNVYISLRTLEEHEQMLLVEYYCYHRDKNER